MSDDITRREFLTTLLVTPMAAVVVKPSNPFTHPWVYKPTEAQRRFFESNTRVLFAGTGGHAYTYDRVDFNEYITKIDKLMRERLT